ncbi:MAG TPA: prephenate dehydrogenase/arogenate dehydrogenase family protein [Myxococcaceae bacterium]|nr:prephenate dehydrogenase/arogenate dehydrogenase family protein [Myxococcaceae bacterium]
MSAPVGIAGLGLIGGSLGLALRASGTEVLGFDVDPSVVQGALSRGAISRGSANPHALTGAAVVFLAAPLHQLVEVGRALAPHLSRGCVVVDVGSVKAALVPQLERALAPPLNFVGGHPMFGADARGIDAADAALVEGAPFVLTPTERTDAAAIDAVEELVQRLGMRPLRMSPEEHDQRVAAVSHLVYLAGAALIRAAPNLEVAGSGFRDATRPAAAPEAMWVEILRLNRQPILAAARRFAEEMEQLLSLDGEPLQRALSEARRRRGQRFTVTRKP